MSTWQDTVMNRTQRKKALAGIPANTSEVEVNMAMLEDQAEISFKAGIREVVESCFQSISDEPEFPDDMPDELWRELNGNKKNTELAMKNSVRLTKKGITERLQAKLNEGKDWGGVNGRG